MSAPAPPSLEGVLETSIYAADLAATARFYEEKLGLAALFRGERLVAFDVGGGGVLLVFQKGSTAADSRAPGGIIPGHDGTGRIHFALAIPADSLEAWRARLAAANIAVTGEFRWPRGGVSLYFSDPDGHVVELATPGLWATR